MSMKRHILTALHEQYNQWEAMFTSMSDTQITKQPSTGMSIKETVAHLYAWQQRSVARLEAATVDLAPVFPDWPADLDAEAESATDQVNAWIAETYRGRSWADMHQDWGAGYLHLLELAEAMPEKDLLDSSRYPWMEGRPLVLVLLGTYDHHQEHMEELSSRA